MKVCFASYVLFSILMGGLVVAPWGGGKPAPKLYSAIQKDGSQAAQNTPVLATSFELVDDLVLLSVKVNDSAPQQFILDTGMNKHALTRRAAQQLGLRFAHAREVQNAGVGEGKTEISAVKGISLRLQGKEIFTGNLPTVEMSYVEEVIGRRIGGILGFPLFKAFVVEIDYANRILRLYDPRSYDYRGEGHVVPIRIADSPFLEARIVAPGGDAVGARLQVDTGSDEALSLNHPFELKNNLPRPRQITIPSLGGGIGGGFESRLGRMEALQLGDIAIERPLTTFSAAAKGLTTTQKYDGRLGGQILKRFTVVFDYSRKRMILEPNGLFGRPFETNLSGIFFTAGLPASSNFVVASVVEGSPAALAGLRKGDRVMAIDARPSAELTLDDLRQMFAKEGRTFTLVIDRGNGRMEITFTTPRLL